MVSLFRNLLLLMLAIVGDAHAALDVRINKTQILLGEPLMLRISSLEDLSTLDLSPLAHDFDLASQTLNRASNHGREEYLLEVTLYPLRSGILRLPALALGRQRSRGINVRVKPAPVSIRAWFPPARPMAREATILHLEIRDDGSFGWDTPIQLDAPHAVIRSLPESIREEMRDGINQTVHHFRWQILPLKEGSVSVQFGMLDAHRYAQRLRYPISNVSLNVQTAPAYLPLNLPIGQPVIRSNPQPKQLAAGKLQAWEVYVHAPGLSAEGLQSLLQYDSPPGIHFYPPAISPVVLDTDEYLRVTLTYHADLSARTFPAIRLPYFDVRTQRIESVSVPASSLMVRDPVRERWLSWIAVVIGMILLSMALWKLALHWRRRKTKQIWLSRISSAQTPDELYAILTKHSPWQARTLRHLPLALNISTSQYTELEALRFGGRNLDRFTTLKKSLVNSVAKTSHRLYPQSFLHA